MTDMIMKCISDEQPFRTPPKLSVKLFFVLSFSLYLDRGLTDPWLACSCNNFMYCTFAETAGFSRNSFFHSYQLKETFSSIVFVKRKNQTEFQ